MSGNSRKLSASDKKDNSGATLFILMIVAGLSLSIASLVFLQDNNWVNEQKLWLISRAVALTSFVVLTAIMAIGLVMSHPLNKKKWNLSRYLLPWHQALMIALFTLIGMHLIFTAMDPKSGIGWGDLWFPIHAKFNPWAMVSGSIGLYLLLLTTISVTMKKWFKKWWLPIHRFSIIIWAFVFFHGIYGGADTADFFKIYYGSGLLLLGLFLWRQWPSLQQRKKTMPRIQTKNPADEEVSSENEILV